MNYWRVMVPSASRGVSARCEVHTFTRDARLFARALPPALVPPAAGAWEVEHLIYAVGLPMPTDVAPAGETGAQATARRAALRTRWTAIARDAPTPAQVSDAVIDEWADLGTRTFIDEIDAFPAHGARCPAGCGEQIDLPHVWSCTPIVAATRVSNRSIARSARRTAWQLPVRGRATISGIVWAENRPAFRFDNLSLGRSARRPQGRPRRGRDDRIYISLKRGNLRIPVTATVVAGRNVHRDRQTVALPASVDRQVWRTIAHELCHSFGLGDEYAELPRRYHGSGGRRSMTTPI